MSKKMSDRDNELQQEKFSSWADNGKACEGCIFSQDRPDICSCDVFVYPKTKPDSVYLDGGSCKYYRSR